MSVIKISKISKINKIRNGYKFQHQLSLYWTKVFTLSDRYFECKGLRIMIGKISKLSIINSTKLDIRFSINYQILLIRVLGARIFTSSDQ